MELTVTLQPKQRAALTKSDSTPVIFYGGAKGGGKSYLVRAKELIRRMRYPNTKGLIVRKTYPELLSNHIRPFFMEYPATRDWYNKSEKTIYWPNGSTTEFSYLKNTDDVFTYQGREYEDISVDEITQHEEVVFKILRSSSRTTNPAIKPRMFLTGNPGGVGHWWVRRLFIQRNFYADEQPSDYGFVQAFVQDNNALIKADPEYVKRLESLPEIWRRAYLYGDWDIFAGQALGELHRDVHLVDPFEIPSSWKVFGAYDHGFNHPFAFGMFAVDPDGNVYLVRHVSSRLKRVDEIARMLDTATGGIGRLGAIHAGEDAFSRQRDGGPSVAELFLHTNPKVILTRANTDRVQGVAQVRQFIAWKGISENGADGKPKFRIFRNCQTAFETLTRMVFDDAKPEDVLKVDADEYGNGGDDDYDMIRYGLMSRPRPLPQKEIKPPATSVMAHIQKKQQQRWLNQEYVGYGN